MTTTRRTDMAFLSFTAILVAATAGTCALIWPFAVTAAHRQSSKLVTLAATSTSPREAQINYQLALILDPANTATRLRLAETQIDLSQPEPALSTLANAGEGIEATRLRVRALIETGSTREAAKQAAALLRPGQNDADVVLIGLAYALDGRASDIADLKPLVTSPEASGALSRAAAGNLPLATTLFASRLPESSKRLLLNEPPSFERELLLGRIYYNRHTQEDLALATKHLEAAVKLNPANFSAHQLLATLYTEQNRLIESTQQANLSEKLRKGRP